MPKLQVHQLGGNDIYKDIVRVPEVHRLTPSCQRIPDGVICKLSVNEKSRYVVVRGHGKSVDALIRMDEKTRDALGVNEREWHEFDFTRSGWWGQLRWALGASEAGYRISSWLGVLGLMLGVLGFIGSLPVLADWAEKLSAFFHHAAK